MNILIINPETTKQNLLQKALVKNHFLKANEIVNANSIKSGYEAFKSKLFDFIFIEISLCKESCFKLLRKYKELNSEIVFMVDDIATGKEILKQHKLNYITTPINLRSLNALFSKTYAKMAVNIFGQKEESLTDNIVSGETNIVPKKIAVKENDGIRFIEIKNIIRCSSDSNYTEIYLENGERILSSKTLKEHGKVLSKAGFFRVHHSHIVDVRRIKKIISKDGLYVKLENDELVELSRRRKEDLLRII